MRSQTLTIVRDWTHCGDPGGEVILPVFYCSECADLFVFASVSSASTDSREAFEKLRPVCEAKDQKPRFCPMCGAKNKTGDR